MQTGVNPEILVSLEPLVGLWCQRRPQIKVYSTFHRSHFFHHLLAKQAGAEEAANCRSIHRRVPFSDSSPPGAAPEGEPPPLSKSAKRFFLGTPKSGFWGRLGGVIPCSRGLVGTSGARSFHLGHNIFLPLASILGRPPGDAPLF